MSRTTESRIDREASACKRSVRRALLALLVFYAWLLATALGPLLSVEGWTLGTTTGALLGYSALSVAALVSLGRASATVLRSVELRAVVSRRLAPFWILGFLGFLAGAVVFSAVSDAGFDSVLHPALFGLATGLGILLSGFTLAQLAHLRALRTDRRLVEHAPDAGTEPGTDPRPSLLQVARESLLP